MNKTDDVHMSICPAVSASLCLLGWCAGVTATKVLVLAAAQSIQMLVDMLAVHVAVTAAGFSLNPHQLS